MAQVRLNREYRHIDANPIQHATVTITSVDIKLWRVDISPPTDCLYGCSTYTVALAFPPNYPFDPPKATFLSNILHPNISKSGDVCLSSLKVWSPSITSRKIIEELVTILITPNIDDPINAEAASLYIQNYPEFARRTIEICSTN